MPSAPCRARAGLRRGGTAAEHSAFERGGGDGVRALHIGAAGAQPWEHLHAGPLQDGGGGEGRPFFPPGPPPAAAVVAPLTPDGPASSAPAAAPAARSLRVRRRWR